MIIEQMAISADFVVKDTYDMDRGKDDICQKRSSRALQGKETSQYDRKNSFIGSWRTGMKYREKQRLA